MWFCSTSVLTCFCLVLFSEQTRVSLLLRVSGLCLITDIFHVSPDWEALDWDAFQASHAVTGSPFNTPRGGEAESWVQLGAPAQEADDWTMIDSDGN